MKIQLNDKIKGAARMVIAALAYLTIVTVLIIIAKFAAHYINFIWNLIP